MIKMRRFCHPKVPPGCPGTPPGRTHEGPKKGPGGQNVCIYTCFTCVLRRARFALFFGLAKGIVKHVPFGAQRRKNLVETD